MPSRLYDGELKRGVPIRRLFVALVWDSLGLPTSELLEADRRLAQIVSAECGTEWDAELYRLYVDSRNQEFQEQLKRLRVGGKMRAWRRPRHMGRSSPRDWSRTISKQAVDWCVRETAAKQARNAAVLVTNNGKLDSAFRQLSEAGVQVLIVGTSRLELGFALRAERVGAKVVRLEDGVYGI